MRRRPFLRSAALALLPFSATANEEAQVTFMGFQMFADQTSRIFVHMTSRPGVSVSRSPGQVVFLLTGAALLARNNKNPLNLQHFPTPAKRARLVQSGADVEVVIELKRDVETQHRLAEADGQVSLQIDFPAQTDRE